MKIMIYSCRDDERVLFEQYARQWNLQLGYCNIQPTMENVHLAEGYPCISVVGTVISDELLREFARLGVKMISTRSIGYEHINIALAKELGVKVANITYSPNAVADFAIMLMLMSLRRARYIMERYRVKDFTLAWNQGRELRNMTVGVVGAGRIGQTVIREISGFGCKILVYNRHQNEEIKRYAEYVEYEELLRRSDIITFHAPATEQTYHLLNRDNVKRLKPGVIIINTSRGALVDNKALIDGLEQNIISAVGLDVIDNEPVIYNVDHKNALLMDHDIAVLESYPNVIITPHTAFFTDQAVRDMVENSLQNCVCFGEDQPIPGEIK
ncbi:MAG: fldH [Oscillospiraceae bacterium]|nr:fldH [Oscillospiraceae bacterium]